MKSLSAIGNHQWLVVAKSRVEMSLLTRIRFHPFQRKRPNLLGFLNGTCAAMAHPVRKISVKEKDKQ